MFWGNPSAHSKPWRDYLTTFVLHSACLHPSPTASHPSMTVAHFIFSSSEAYCVWGYVWCGPSCELTNLLLAYCVFCVWYLREMKAQEQKRFLMMIE
jgi:Flp pilus assembly protein TadB